MKLPVYFISHGGGPWPWMKEQEFLYRELSRSLAAMPGELGAKPKAILCVSAHWETPEFTVQTSAAPPMLYDYYGFPEHTYHIEYNAPGSPQLASRVAGLLGGAGFRVDEDAERGFDHGTFVPLAAAWPNADIPVVQLSIKQNYDPESHLAAGRALAPLRDEGIFILASGLSYHNLRMFGPQASAPSREFDAWLGQAVCRDIGSRTDKLRNWVNAPSARVAHPREDHLVPLFVAVGAAEDDAATRVYHEDSFFGGLAVSSYRFG